MTDTFPNDAVLPGDYTYTARDGTLLKFPAGTKRSEIQEGISQHEGISPLDSFASSASRGAALGFGDEIRAAIHATFPEVSRWMMKPPFDGKLTAGPVRYTTTGGAVGGETDYNVPADLAPPPVQDQTYTPQVPRPPPVSEGPTWQRRYDENLATARGEERLDKFINPNASLAGHIAGNVITSAALPGGWLKPQALIPWMLKSGVGNAALGGAQGFGEGTEGNRLEHMGWGALIGGGVGVGVPVLGAGLKTAYKFLPTAMDKVANVLDASAPRIANESVSSAAATPTIVQSGMRADVADWLRGSSDALVRRSTLARIADDLASSRITPEQAQAQLDALGEASTIANVSPNVARSARDSYILPGEGREVIDANLNAQRQRLGGDLREAGGVNDAPRMAQARQEARDVLGIVGEQAYDVALRTLPLEQSDAMRKLAAQPDVQEAMLNIMEMAKQSGRELTPAEVAHAVKRELNRTAEAGVNNAGRPVNASWLQDTANAWEQALWQANPHIRAADLRYAQAGGLERSLDQGQNYAKTGRGEAVEAFDPSVVAQELPTKTAGEQTMMRWGAQNDVRAGTSGEPQTRSLVRALRESDPVEGVRPRLGQLMPDRMDPLMREVNAQTIYGNTDRQIRGGAVDRAGDVQTALTNMPGGGVPTDPRAFLTRAGQWALDRAASMRNPTELMRNEYARMATTMDKEQQREALEIMADLLKNRRLPPTQAGVVATEPLVIDMTRRPNQ